ncbi:MAG: GDP-fucose synthetase [Omnitrophica bacterium RIFCSPLOWO2_01_FULL_45_10]|nr:MAG: GDP-fucose synthetase [Omnitrophica bacterium RIFCSPLOWO2_01_FULL_45_10]
MNKYSKIFITNYDSMLGNALERRLRDDGFRNLLKTGTAEFNLKDQRSVEKFFQDNKPDYVFLIPAKSGGIMLNINRSAELLYDNLEAQNNVIHSSWLSGVERLLMIGASCVYPKNSSQPIKEEYLLTGPLEPTSEAYSLAKIAGIKLCEHYNRQYKTAFLTIVPATVYGPGDDFDVDSSHVLPALIRRFHEAKIKDAPSAIVWGTGNARREFIYVDDLIDACLFLMRQPNNAGLINIGTSQDASIKELSRLIKEIVGFNGNLEFDAAKPEGASQKLLDTTRMTSSGWTSKVDLMTGIDKTYRWYINSL